MAVKKGFRMVEISDDYLSGDRWDKPFWRMDVRPNGIRIGRPVQSWRDEVDENEREEIKKVLAELGIKGRRI